MQAREHYLIIPVDYMIVVTGKFRPQALKKGEEKEKRSLQNFL